ncbi:3'-5' exonuclease [Salmonella enterica subsp. enterica serovar Infantis]|uniref:3'-5' exonuclease n=1 Tax=Salmonella enterica subsp. enterica serovar Javiana TaxID=363569 RepID=A0A5H6X9V2_SALET|nr:3'-5' exonuclease [Salmonella enterica]EAA7390254.1 3'-5' exonuclease [Salmonella enterica subsp. enterica]EBU7777492.1 3'-5' exonuclease [Salmonella enterica subsp. enterica serovar Javiana]ECE8267422.1 3'-5' exonuclease [Salmonella enterica subsp. enterica serovar Berkeley]ECS9358830.1 3'-5' exonuclease [Salmonella enterica subsp. enterica serovar Newport]ECX3547442.1 3'-5' exonuclease [Salmonella enterica subsp. enterica serovar Derby]EDV0657834.1 3'-5' exonuclease [Salmonella enterica 
MELNTKQLKYYISLLAQQWLDDNRLFIDTETTGLGDDAEIVEICIIDSHGFILLNTLVKPTKPIPDEAIAIHGITNEMVAYAPAWTDICGAVEELIRRFGFVIYNADYDLRLIRQTYALNGRPSEGAPWMLAAHSVCAMKLYAEYRGEPGKYHGYKWHKLVDAAAHEGVVIEGKAHRALADCKMTLGVIKALAQGGAK